MKNVFLSVALAAFLLVGFNTVSFATTSNGYSISINKDDPPKAAKAETKNAKATDDKAKTTECKDKAKSGDAKSCCSSKSSCSKSCAGSTSCSKDKKPEKK